MSATVILFPAPYRPPLPPELTDCLVAFREHRAGGHHLDHLWRLYSLGRKACRFRALPCAQSALDALLAVDLDHANPAVQRGLERTREVHVRALHRRILELESKMAGGAA